MNLDGLWAYYRSLPVRERIALLALIVFLFFAGLFQLGWSAAEGSRELRARLPEQERKLAQALQLEKRVEELRARPQPAPLEGDRLRQRAQELAAPRLIDLPAGAVILDGSRGVAFDATVNFDAWLDWVAVLQLELSLRLTACDISRGEGGRVRVTARFALADGSS